MQLKTTQAGLVWATIISCSDDFSRLLFPPSSPTSILLIMYRLIHSQCSLGHISLLPRFSHGLYPTKGKHTPTVASETPHHLSHLLALHFPSCSPVSRTAGSLTAGLGQLSTLGPQDFVLASPLEGNAEMLFSQGFHTDHPP